MISLKTYIPYYKENLRLAMPVILSQVGQITVQLADTAMVGWYGGDDPTPLAAVSFGTSIFYIIFISAMGLAFGLTPLVGGTSPVETNATLRTCFRTVSYSSHLPESPHRPYLSPYGR